MFGRKLVVQQHRPWDGLLQLVALIAVLVGATAMAYVYGRATVSLEFAAAKEKREELKAQVANLTDANVGLRERIAVLERAAQIDRQAYREVDDYILELQSEIYTLREEVGFYRGIVSAQPDQGLRIQSFEVTPAPGGRDYSYYLVLTQDMKNDTVASGIVTVSVSGEKSGKAIRLAPDQIRQGETRDIEFRFKHFQRIEGRFALPVGFEPRSVFVKVLDSTAKKTVTEKKFDWRWPIG